MPTPPAPPSAAAPTKPARTELVIQANDLLQGARRVWIEHAGERYQLQATRNGKLILTK